MSDIQASTEASAWSFADGQGLFTGRIYSGSSDFLQLNTPAGCAAVEGIHDPLSCRWDAVAGQVIDYLPPAPADDQWQTWAWNTTTKRWVSTPTLDAIKRAARQRMAGEWNVAKAAGVTLGGKTAPTDADSWTRYLAIKAMAEDGGWIDVPIPLVDGSFELLTQANAGALWAALKDMERTLLGRLRDRVQAIDAATTQTEVEAVVW